MGLWAIPALQTNTLLAIKVHDSHPFSLYARLSITPDAASMPKVHIPGPWLAKFTVLPLVLRQALRRNFDGLHGPHSVVQTGPRRVSVNDARGLRDVFLSAPVRRLDRYPNLVFLHN
jgi:hypothetical protein